MSSLISTTTSKPFRHLQSYNCEADYYEHILDACLLLKVFNKLPFDTKKTYLSEQLLDSIQLLLFFLQGSLPTILSPSGVRFLMRDFNTTHSLDQTVVTTLVYLDHGNTMSHVISELNIPLQDFFKNWIMKFILEVDVQLSTAIAPVKKVRYYRLLSIDIRTRKYYSLKQVFPTGSMEF